LSRIRARLEQPLLAPSSSARSRVIHFLLECVNHNLESPKCFRSRAACRAKSPTTRSSGASLTTKEKKEKRADNPPPLFRASHGRDVNVHDTKPAPARGCAPCRRCSLADQGRRGRRQRVEASSALCANWLLAGQVFNRSRASTALASTTRRCGGGVARRVFYRYYFFNFFHYQLRTPLSLEPRCCSHLGHGGHARSAPLGDTDDPAYTSVPPPLLARDSRGFWESGSVSVEGWGKSNGPHHERRCCVWVDSHGRRRSCGRSPRPLWTGPAAHDPASRLAVFGRGGVMSRWIRS